VLHPVRPSVCLSVRLSICPVPTIYSKSESDKNFKFNGNMTMEDSSNWESKFEA